MKLIITYKMIKSFRGQGEQKKIAETLIKVYKIEPSVLVIYI